MKNSPHGRNTLCTLLHSGQDASHFLHCHDIGQLENCVTYMMSNTIHRKHLSCMQGKSCEQNSLSWHKVGGIVQLMAGNKQKQNHQHVMKFQVRRFIGLTSRYLLSLLFWLYFMVEVGRFYVNIDTIKWLNKTASKQKFS